MKTIFVIDDSDVNLITAKRALEGKYNVRTMPSAVKMLSIIEKIRPDLILLDIEMPEMDGFAAITKLKENKNTADIPVIFLTAYETDEIEALGLEHGAIDFIKKPFSAPVLLNRIKHHLDIEELLQKRTQRLQHLTDSILEVFADMVESRDRVTGGHIDRTSKYMEILVSEMLKVGVYEQEIKSWDLKTIVSSARLHDVGKIAISDLILNKPGKLTEKEYEQVKKHVEEGERIIEKMIDKTGEETVLFHAKRFAGYHHEKWDGTGYPRGLAGKEIPLEGRIVAIVDVYDALVSDRPYRKALSREEAESIIWKEKGKHFDPAIVNVFAGITDQFAHVYM